MLAELSRHIFQIWAERFILSVLGPSAFGDPVSESQATDRSTFCPMPGGRSQAASGPLRPFCLDTRHAELAQRNAQRPPKLNNAGGAGIGPDNAIPRY